MNTNVTHQMSSVLSALRTLSQILVAASVIGLTQAHAESADTSNTIQPVEDFVRSGSGNFVDYSKFIVQIDDQGKLGEIQFQNLSKFDRHSDLLRTLPPFKGMTITQLDNLSYRANPVRKVVLGVLNTRCADDGICWNNFNIVSEDVPRADQIVAIHKALNKPSIVGNLDYAPLKFQPLPHQVAGIVNMSTLLARAGVPIMTPEGTPNRVAYTDAWNVGRLLWINSQEDMELRIQKGEINERTILASEQAMRDFPPVAGVITGSPLTPASHAVLLAQMYSIPVVYMKDASKKLQTASGELAYLSAIKAPGATLNETSVGIAIGITDHDVKKALEFRPQRNLKVALDTAEEQIRSARELDMSRVGAYGGKGSQIGLIMKTVPDLTVSEAAAVPIAIYRKFMVSAKATSGEPLLNYVNKRLAEIAAGQEASAAAGTILADIRKQIEKAEIPAEIATQIRAAIEKLFPGEKIRLKLRSSSNVEDGSEFNGAGLYDSKGAWLRNSEKPQDLEKTIKQVWASLYTQRGYIARKRFNVDESMVGMGVVAHMAFKGELYNGVATLYVSPDQDTSFECITQIGEDLVTHANGDEESEQITINYDKLAVQQPFKGNSKTRTLMSSKDYFSLRDAMAKLAPFYSKKSGEAHIEIEWKLMPGKTANETQLYIKQVRAVPRTPTQKAADGSAYYILSASNSNLPPIRQPSHGFEALLLPRQLQLTMPGLTEKELMSGSVALKQLDYVVQGEKFSATDLPLKVSKDSSGEPVINVALKHPFLKKVSIEYSLPYPRQPIISLVGIGVYGGVKADSTDGEWLKNLYNGPLQMNSVMEYDLGSGDLTGFQDPSVIGTGKYVITVKGKIPLSVSLEQVKERGQGDGREALIGRAVINGLLKRPIQVGAHGIGYGANHHEGWENYVFDLFMDSSLTGAEKKWLLDNAGRYLYVATGEQGDHHEAHFVRKTGTVKKAGSWTIKQITKPQPL